MSWLVIFCHDDGDEVVISRHTSPEAADKECNAQNAYRHPGDKPKYKVVEK